MRIPNFLLALSCVLPIRSFAVDLPLPFEFKAGMTWEYEYEGDGLGNHGFPNDRGRVRYTVEGVDRKDSTVVVLVSAELAATVVSSSSRASAP